MSNVYVQHLLLLPLFAPVIYNKMVKLAVKKNPDGKNALTNYALLLHTHV